METTAQSSGIILWLMVGFFALFIYLQTRSQKKREQEMATKVNALQKSDQVIISGGIVGTVVGFKDNALEVKIAEGVKLTVLKSAIVGFASDSKTPQTQQGGAK